MVAWRTEPSVTVAQPLQGGTVQAFAVVCSHGFTPHCELDISWGIVGRKWAGFGRYCVSRSSEQSRRPGITVHIHSIILLPIYLQSFEDGVKKFQLQRTSSLEL